MSIRPSIAQLLNMFKTNRQGVRHFSNCAGIIGAFLAAIDSYPIKSVHEAATAVMLCVVSYTLLWASVRLIASTINEFYRGKA